MATFSTTLHTTKFRCLNVGKQLKCFAMNSAHLFFDPGRQQPAAGPYKQRFLSPLPPYQLSAVRTKGWRHHHALPSIDFSRSRSSRRRLGSTLRRWTCLVLVPQHANFIAGADSEGEQEGPRWPRHSKQQLRSGRWPRHSERQAGGGRVTAAAGGGGITVGVRRAAGQGEAGQVSAEDAGRREGKGCHLSSGAGPGPSSSPTELQGCRPHIPWP